MIHNPDISRSKIKKAVFLTQGYQNDNLSYLTRNRTTRKSNAHNNIQHAVRIAQVSRKKNKLNVGIPMHFSISSKRKTISQAQIFKYMSDNY